MPASKPREAHSTEAGIPRAIAKCSNTADNGLSGREVGKIRFGAILQFSGTVFLGGCALVAFGGGMLRVIALHILFLTIFVY